MIVRTLADALNSERKVEAANWFSCRLLLKEDRMGFSLHDTTIRAGTSTTMHYQNHLEAVYCIEGEGTLTDLESGQDYPITPGSLYALSGHERHILTAQTQMRMICVFNPPLVGPETHDQNGVYPVLVETD